MKGLIFFPKFMTKRSIAIQRAARYIKSTGFFFEPAFLQACIVSYIWELNIGFLPIQ